MSGGPAVLTFGCRLNLYESEVMRRHAAAAGLADTVIVNTCAVTAEAERQARQAIRRVRRERPGARIVVTGCAATVDPAKWAAMPEIDRVLDNAAKLRPESWGAAPDLAAPGPSPAAEDGPAGRRVPLLQRLEGHTRGFVEVQNGCDHRCTFCIIPFGRGPSRSVPPGEVVRQVRAFAAAGIAEVVLSGVDLTAWGADLPGRPALGVLVRRVLALVPELPRLRLSSLDPVEIDETLWALIAAEPRLMPHLHLSLQSGDDLILKRMKRRHCRAEAVAVAARARALRSGIALGADLIAGFPTETEPMFANTLRLVEDCDLDLVHVFPYSARPGTPAARMPQVPPPVRKERAARLRAAGAAALQRFLAAQAGREAGVLMERGGTGHTEHFAPVTLDRPVPPGALVQARLGAVAGTVLLGTVPSEPGHGPCHPDQPDLRPAAASAIPPAGPQPP